MSEKDPPRFAEPDREEKLMPEDKNCYCVHCFQDKPESAMSVVDECCQACLDRAFDRDNRWDDMLNIIRKWTDYALENRIYLGTLWKIKAYLQGR